MGPVVWMLRVFLSSRPVAGGPHRLPVCRWPVCTDNLLVVVSCSRLDPALAHEVHFVQAAMEVVEEERSAQDMPVQEGEQHAVLGHLLKINVEGRPFDAALFGETVVRGFAKLWGDPLLSDINLVVGGDKLPAHRLVLCAWSDTFRSMLENADWAESSLRDLPVHLDDPRDHPHFKNMCSMPDHHPPPTIHHHGPHNIRCLFLLFIC